MNGEKFGDPTFAATAAVQPQNDIADLLDKFIQFLQRMRDWFDALKASNPQALAGNGCVDGLVESVRESLIKAALQFATEVPGLLTQFVQCQFGGDVSPQAAQQEWIGCAIRAVISYLQTRDIANAVQQFIGCMFAGGGGGTTPGGAPVLNPVTRCGG